MKKDRRIETPPVGSGKPGWPDLILIGLCLLAAVTLRILVFLDVRTVPDVTSDGLFYQDIAKAIAAGTFWKDAGVFSFSPLYVFYLTLVGVVSDAGINAVRLSQLVLGLGSTGLIFLIARTLLSPRASLIALGLAAFYLPFVFFEVQILGVTLVLFLMLLSVWLLVAGSGGSVRTAFSGWVLGLAALGAPNLLALGAPVVAWLLFFAARPGEADGRGWKPVRGDVIRAAVFAVAMGVGILPVTLWNHHVSGQLIPVSSQGGINFFIGNNAQATGYFTAPPGMEDSLLGINIKDSQRVAEAEAGHPLKPTEVSSYWFGKGMRFILSDPGAEARLLLRKAFLYINRYETPLDVDYDSYKTYSAALRLPLPGFGLVAVLGLGGLVLACFRFRRHALPVLLFATISATVVAFFVSDRYRLPAVPFLILFSALAIDWAWAKWREGKVLPAVLGAIALLPVAAVVWSPVGYAASPASLYFNLAMSYLKQNDLQRARVELEKCVQAEPGWGEARFQLASLAQGLGDNEGAWTQLVVLERVRNPDVLCLRGKVEAGSGLLMSAQKTFGAALELKPDHAESRQRLAAVTAQLAAETPEARRQRGRFLQEDAHRRQQGGQHERAIADFTEIRMGGFEGVDPALIDMAIGFEYTLLNRYDEAEKCFESALALSPANAGLIHKNLAIVAIKQRDRAKAQLHFQEYARLIPNDPQLSQIRDMLAQLSGGTPAFQGLGQ